MKQVEMNPVKFVDFISFHIKIFKYFGFWFLNQDDPYKYLYIFYNRFCTVAWFLTLVSQVTSFVLNLGDMNESTDIIYITVCCIVAFFKLLAIYDKLDLIKVLLVDMNEPLLQPKCLEHLELCQDIRIATDVENIHRVSIFILSLGSILVLCTALFQMTQITLKEDPAKYLMLVSILICLLVQQLIHCWFCNEIILKSARIFTSAYNTPWVECDIKFKKILLNFLTQTIKPIEIEVGGLFTLSNSVFISIIRSSYSYFAVLRTMQENSSSNN